MSILTLEGFDAQDYGKKGWVSLSSGQVYSPSVSTVAGRITGSSIQMSNTGLNNYSSLLSLKRPITASAQITMGVAVKQNSYSGNCGFCVSLYSDLGATEHLTLLGNPVLNTVELHLGSFGGGQLTAASIPPFQSAWNYFEIQAVIGTAGSCIVRLNGGTTPIINYSGNTKNGGTSTNISNVEIGVYSLTGSAPNAQFDDIYVCDGLGSTNNTFLGDVQVQTLLPTGAGSSTQFTPTGSANNYANVNDVPDSSSTYNSSSTVGQRDTYTMGDLSGGTGKIFGVQQVTHAFKTTAGTGNLKAAQLSSGTVSYGTVNALSTSNTGYLNVFDTNPATSAAYTPSDINGLEAGAEVA